jgi:ribosomal protein S18 acetylase RimI-like enzyme
MMEIKEVKELNLPAGYTARPMQGEADLPAMLAVFNASEAAAGNDAEITLEIMRYFYQHLTNCDPARDALLVENAEGLVAYARTYWQKQDNQAAYRFPLALHVHPNRAPSGLHDPLLHWLEARSRQVAAEQGHPREAEASLEMFADGTNLALIAFLERHGYAPVRFFARMERPNLDNIPDLPLPPGVEVRPVQPEHLRAIWDASNEAFRDHWGATEPTEEDYQRFLTNPVEFQPEVWKVAWDRASNEVVGMVLGYINHEENQSLRRKLGWTENISVSKPWRKQGVARALMAENLRELKARGMEYAALGVDTDNPTGAMRVYETMGFRPVKRNFVYQKPLWPERPGNSGN